MKTRRPLPAARRRAVTLVELTVTIAVMLVIGGLALEIMNQSDRATRKITRYQAALQYCQQALTQASQSVRAAVAPANLALADPAQAAPHFEKDSISFVAYERGQTGLCRVTLRNVENQAEAGTSKEDKSGAILRGVLPVALPTGQPKDLKIQKILETNLGGAAAEGFTPTIQFAYAAAPRPGQQPDYQDAWTTATWPALVQIKVRAEVAKDPRPIELQTAVIPGLLVTENKPATADAPATATTPAAAPQAPASPAPIQKMVTQPASSSAPQPAAQPVAQPKVPNYPAPSEIKEVKK